MSVILREQSQLLLAKLESVYGTDSTPSGANALMVQNITVKPEFEKAARNNITGMLGAQGAITVSQKVAVDFEIELSASGTAGTAPAYAAALRACGLAETITAGISVEYTPVDSAFESMSFYWRVGSVQHAIIGARGKASLELSTGGVPVVKFSFIGLYTDPTTGNASPTGVDFSVINAPTGVYSDTVTAMSFMGEAIEMKTLTVDMGNDVQYSNLVNSEDVQIVGRAGAVSTSFRLSEAQYVSMNAAVKNDTAGEIAYTLGATAGRIVDIAIPNAQLSNAPSISWDNSMAIMSLDAAIVPTTRNSDFVLTFK